MHNIVNDSELESTKEIVNAVCLLEEKAFEILLSNPGVGKKEFMEALMKDNEELIITAYGIVADDIVDSLLKFWDTSYYDINSGEEHTFKEWAKEFATKEKVQNYNEKVFSYKSWNNK